MKRYINKALVALCVCLLPQMQAVASSHREAPLISNDPQVDNTDLYAFRSPCDPTKIVIIANYIPFEHPAGGPNWYTFSKNAIYEIHIKNKATGTSDDITYRFRFNVVNEDTTTFFNIRLGKQNQKTTYTCERRIGTGAFTTILTNGIVPPANIGPRSIEGPAGLHATSYDSLMMGAVMNSNSGEKIFCGPADDPFFVDLGGAFDVGNFRNPGRDAVAKFNVHSIVLEIPISTLQKDGLSASSAVNILDPNFVIGVWASASRPTITTLSATGGNGQPTVSSTYVQVSRIGMPLNNEVINPIGQKDRWNATTPYTDATYIPNYVNPELALYMDDSQFGTAVPGLAALRIQTNSLGAFDFRNGKKGLFGLKGTAAVAGTAFAGPYMDFLLPDSTSPRSVDILPIFLTGVPNQAPYQLATGKNGNPLAAGKPFINNFLPVVGDMLRLNMAVPPTPRNDPNFSSEGLLQAAVLGLTNAAYNTDTTLQFIPNMDGFPNGRRLEDDITTIELQAVSGVVLAAIGLWYDDYTGGPNALTPNLLSVLTFSAGVTHNDTTFRACMPYLQQPWRGFTGEGYVGPTTGVQQLPLNTPVLVMNAFPNPFTDKVTFHYKLATQGNVTIQVTDMSGRTVQLITEGVKTAGEYDTQWNNSALPAGNYLANLVIGNTLTQTVKLVKIK